MKQLISRREMLQASAWFMLMYATGCASFKTQKKYPEVNQKNVELSKLEQNKWYEEGKNIGRREQERIRSFYFNPIVRGFAAVNRKGKDLEQIIRPMEKAMKRHVPRNFKLLCGKIDAAMGKEYRARALEFEWHSMNRPGLNCSTVMISPNITKSRYPIFGRNFDLYWFLESYVGRLNRTSSGVLNTFSDGLVPLSGPVYTTNGRVALAVNDLFYGNGKLENPDDKIVGMVPYLSVIQTMAEEFDSTEEVLYEIQKYPIGGRVLIMVLDIEGDMGVVEVTSDGKKYHRPKSDYFVATNHSPKENDVEVLTDIEDSGFFGKYIKASSGNRRKQIQKLLQDRTIDPQDMMKILKNKDIDPEYMEYTTYLFAKSLMPVSNDGITATLSSVVQVLNPDNPSIYHCLGRPGPNEYELFDKLT